MRISDWSSDVCSSDLLDRASAALKLVQRDVRYIYVGLGNGNLTPATAEETWQRRYGDCKGKTALLLALLARLGIEAEAVLANNSGGDDGLDERLPNPGMFDHVLVRARIDGKRSEEHTSELQSLMRISSDVFCLKKKNKIT